MGDQGAINLTDRLRLVFRVSGRDPARRVPFPPRALDAFLAGGPPAATGVVSFADQVGVAPGIVVGRLQHSGTFRHDQLNGLRKRAAVADAART